MTKKDYELIANSVLKSTKELKILMDAKDGWIVELASKELNHIALLIDSLSKDLAIDNPRFNREKFYTACGL